jgi:DnaJ-class molecular chaperone
LTTEATLLSDTQTFYEVLGLAKDVALPDIKTAYRQMARRYHPDVCPPEELEENTKRFIEVQEAYETLSDPRRRAMYDAQILNFGSRKLWNLNDMDGVHWKRRWEGQLSGLQYQDATRDADSDSWGARMRRKVQEQQHQSSS